MQPLSASEGFHLGARVINPRSLYPELSKSPLSKANSGSVMVRDLLKSPFKISCQSKKRNKISFSPPPAVAEPSDSCRLTLLRCIYQFWNCIINAVTMSRGFALIAS